MTTNISKQDELDLILRFPYSPKVREIILGMSASKRIEDFQTKHLKESHHTSDFVERNNVQEFSTPVKSSAYETNVSENVENTGSLTELAKMNAKLEGLIYNTPRSEKKVEEVISNYNPILSNYIYRTIEAPTSEIKHVAHIYESPEKDGNVISRADRQLAKSRALFGSVVIQTTKNYDDILKGDDLKASHVLINDVVVSSHEEVHENHISPEVLPILEEIRSGKIANLGNAVEEKKTVVKTLEFTE